MKPVIALTIVLFLSACGGGGALSLLTGGGPNVAANVQAGKENNQGANIQTGEENNQALSQFETTKTETTSINSDKVTILNQQVPMWYILLLILGWMLPSPREIWRGITEPFRGLIIRKKK
jgi:hypothetical protein